MGDKIYHDDGIVIIDDALEPSLIYEAWDWCQSGRAPWQWNQYGQKGHKMKIAPFWGNAIASPEEGRQLEDAEGFFQDLWDVVKDFHAGRLRLFRCFLNGQTFGDDSDPHHDANERTCVFYINPDWHPMWQGETVFYSDSSLRHIVDIVAPKPNRLVSFPGAITHWGRAPSRYCYTKRITIAYQFNYF